MLALLHIGSRLFELFSKELRVKKQPGRPLSNFKSSSSCNYVYVLYIVYLLFSEKNLVKTIT